VNRKFLITVAALSAAALVAGCGDSSSDSGNDEKPAVTVASKGFTESLITTEAYKQALEAKGYTVTRKDLASTAIAIAAAEKGEITMYPEYTTTLLTDVLKNSAPPSDVDAQVPLITEGLAPKGLAVLTPAPFNNDNQVACTQKAVDENNLTTLSSLGAASGKLVYSANPEHTTRADGLPLLQKEYGVSFKQVIKVAINLRYRPVEQGQADCVYAFGTDPKIAANKLVVLTDDKGKFQGAPYQGIPVVSKEFLDSAPADFAATINAVSAALTSDAVRGMNAAVDLDKEDPEDVAAGFLEAAGLN
jgi:osmoprotectant transport system substrate-binding protein